MKPRIAKRNVVAPPDYDAADVYAIQALAKGIANASQQQRCVEFIVNGISAAFDQAFRPGAPDETNFALGKAFVGQQIYKLIHLNPAILEKKNA